jgi:bifunctional non-homologous end joining protein LigD
VATVAIHEPGENRTGHYARVTDLAGIIGLTQMGVLEIHPWGARADDPEKPDRMVFDLDPDPSVPWQTVAMTALLLRSELQRLGLRSWVKTTGGKGLHVALPVARNLGWDVFRDFARAFVDTIVAMEPRLFTANIRKARRTDKIFIDYLRNARGATAIAAYGSRARPGAPVSVPLHWQELEGMVERPVFTVRNLGQRLAGLDTCPWADMPGTRQSVTKAVRAKVGLA